MTWGSRVFALFFVTGALAVPAAGLSGAGCGTDAVGIEACRRIEEARCMAAASCGYTEEQVETCQETYRDLCLRGIENTAAEPSDSQIEACIAAVEQVRVCAERGAATVADCPEAQLVPGTDQGITPCAILTTEQVEQLAACAFAATPAEADAGGVDGGGAGGAGGEGGSGGAGGSGGTGGSGAGDAGGTGGSGAGGSGGSGAGGAGGSGGGSGGAGGA